MQICSLAPPPKNKDLAKYRVIFSQKSTFPSMSCEAVLEDAKKDEVDSSKQVILACECPSLHVQDILQKEFSCLSCLNY